MKTVYLTNIPAPYRENCHEIVSSNLNKNYLVIYCSKIEPNRKWSFALGRYKRIFLKATHITLGNKTSYLRSNILSVLKKENPKVIILVGLSLPMILSFFWAKFSNCKVISSSDVTPKYNQSLTFVHKLIRYFLYNKMDAHIGASKKTIKLFERYGVKKRMCFISPLSINNKDFRKSYKSMDKRNFDILLCGQFIPIKLFDFSLDVIHQLYIKKKNLKIKLVGYGPMKDHIISRLKNMGVKFKYRGFVQPSKLKTEYASAKLFLFPTKRDAWGIVANEACAVGTPVVTCNNAGAANELVKNGINGYVLKLDVNIWAQKIEKLLNNKILMNKFSKNALKSVKSYNSNNTAKGITDAIRYAQKH